MKRILIFATTSILIISSLLLISSAMQPRDYVCVLQFENQNKAYPITDSLETCVPFFEYYELESMRAYLDFELYYGEETVTLSCSRNNTNITVIGTLVGTYPNYSYFLINTSDGACVDFGIYRENGVFKVAKFNGTSASFVRDIYIEADGGMLIDFEMYTRPEPINGAKVEFPMTPEEVIAPPILENLFDGATTFIGGIGGAFGLAFTTVFLSDGKLNALSITLLCLFGLALGYGVIRWITGTFRKET